MSPQNLNMTLNQTFFALSDPTRRQVLAEIKLGPKPVGEIAETLPVSRPAVSQHLRVLKEAGLVQETKAGTRHIYALSPVGLAALKEFFEDYWTAALTPFKTFAEETAPKRTAWDPLDQNDNDGDLDDG